MPNQSRGRSRPMRGRATLTTVESRNTMPDPSTAATRIQRRRSVICSLLRALQILKPRPARVRISPGSGRLAGGYQARFVGGHDGLHPVIDMKLVEDMGDMRLDRRL